MYIRKYGVYKLVCHCNAFYIKITSESFNQYVPNIKCKESFPNLILLCASQ